LNINPCNALILAGGFSSRMGMDKSMIDYHGVPQHLHVAALLKPFVADVYLSCRAGQSIECQVPIITDTISDIGPMSGLIAAFEKNPNTAWLVMACDMPLVDEAVLQQLFDERDASKQATYFINPDSSMPEPLLAIYEASMLPLLKSHIDQQQYSMNRLLQHSDGKPLIPNEPAKLISVNTPEELFVVRRMLAK
jgi:molybdopterin-guanine dinucleotide biosynthesis protein A